MLTNLRVYYGLLVATIVEGHHEGVLLMTTTLYALTLKGRERPMAQFRVVAYEPSTAEQRWHAAIRTHNPITCRPCHLGGVLGSLVDAERQELERLACPLCAQ